MGETSSSKQQNFLKYLSSWSLALFSTKSTELKSVNNSRIPCVHSLTYLFRNTYLEFINVYIYLVYRPVRKLYFMMQLNWLRNNAFHNLWDHSVVRHVCNEYCWLLSNLYKLPYWNATKLLCVLYLVQYHDPWIKLSRQVLFSTSTLFLFRLTVALHNYAKCLCIYNCKYIYITVVIISSFQYMS